MNLETVYSDLNLEILHPLGIANSDKNRITEFIDYFLKKGDSFDNICYSEMVDLVFQSIYELYDDRGVIDEESFRRVVSIYAKFHENEMFLMRFNYWLKVEEYEEFYVMDSFLQKLKRAISPLLVENE